MLNSTSILIFFTYQVWLSAEEADGQGFVSVEDREWVSGSYLTLTQPQPNPAGQSLVYVYEDLQRVGWEIQSNWMEKLWMLYKSGIYSHTIWLKKRKLWNKQDWLRRTVSDWTMIDHCALNDNTVQNKDNKNIFCVVLWK